MRAPSARCQGRAEHPGTTLFPCNECAKLIIQSGIKKVYYENGDTISKEASLKMFELSNVSVSKHKNSVEIHLIP